MCWFSKNPDSPPYIDVHFMDVQRSFSINGNGFCFILSLVVAMEKDHQIMISNPEARRLILQHLTDNHQKCVDFYRINTPERQHISEHVTDNDMFLTEVIDFFEDRNFDRDVVDLLVKICADALGFSYTKTTMGKLRF